MRHFVSGDFDRLTQPRNFIDEYGTVAGGVSGSGFFRRRPLFASDQ
jgi:hypothetical protein